MNINTETITTMTEANQNFSKVASGDMKYDEILEWINKFKK